MLPPNGKSGSSVSHLAMIIEDSPIEWTVTPNVTSDNRGAYTDHDLSNGDACVSATLSSNSFTQIEQNYLISTRHAVWCNGAQGSSFNPRYWNIVIDDPTACDALLCTSASAPCTVVPVKTTDFERILPGNAFSSSSSPVVFQFTQNGTGYSVQTDAKATIAQGSLTNARTMTYTGTAKLYHSGTAISGSFSFAFQLVLEEF